MTENTFTRCLFGLVSVLAVACSTATEKSDSVDQKRIHQHYAVSYDQEKDSTSASAEFRFGDISGTTLELTGTGGVTHTSYSLSRTNFAGTFYLGSGSGFQATHSFSFTDANEKKYTNSEKIIPIAFKSAPSSMSRSITISISWEGAAVVEKEEVTLTIWDEGRPSELQTFSTRSVGAISVSLTSSDLSRLTDGSKVMMLERKKVGPLQEAAEAGGLFSASYKTSKIPVTLTP